MSPLHRPSRALLALTPLVLGAALAGAPALADPAGADSPRGSDAAGPQAVKQPLARGTGGAVASVDLDASRIGRDVLARGGNAVDAAVAMAAALGVTEPFSAGIGGGGYLVYRDARTGRVSTLDGRETAPATIPTDAFVDPATGQPYRFSPELVTSGVSVGTPGTLATWSEALRRWGSRSLSASLAPAARLAARGFVVDQTFHDQVVANQERFRAFTSTRRLFLPGGQAPAVGSRFRNPDLARTYRLLQREGIAPLYRGRLGEEVVRAVRRPPIAPGTTLPVPRGHLSTADLRAYRVTSPRPTRVDYRGLDVYGMGGSSSGGSTVGEILNILERHPLRSLPDTGVLHLLLEASARAFADRAAYVGDRRFVDVPDDVLLSDAFAAQRDCTIDPLAASAKPVAAGALSGSGGCAAATGRRAEDHENVETTNLTVVDRWGDVVEYTLTIEQTGGSGIVVPGRGFLLNNELTDFSLVYDPADPNRLAPGKRPRSSMAPTIVLDGDRPVLAVGSPGGSTIITTVAQVLVDRLDRRLSLLESIADPRVTQPNVAAAPAEQAFLDRYGAGLEALGHRFVLVGDGKPGSREIGAATGIEIDGRRLTAVAEPSRRGGGSALVVRPALPLRP